MSTFLQEPPKLNHPFQSDRLLQALLKRHLTKADYSEVEEDLNRFGTRILNEIEDLGQEALRSLPFHQPFDAWGKRIDLVHTSKAWARLGEISAEEGLIAIGYERKYGEYSRLVQFSKLLMFHPSSAYFTCPLAMTDGAARLIECHGDKKLKTRAFKHLTSRKPKLAWTSGQWMTEKTGGSDVSRTETVARFEEGRWRLYGIKWFTSAITSQMAMALARIEEEGQTQPGSRGLGLFYIELRNKDGGLNQIEVLRLKDKLGTKALPTAELKLNGTIAQLVAPAPDGVKTISSLFNVTRLYNACTSLGAYRRLLNLSVDYAKRREAFKHKLIDQPLHRTTLAKLEVDYAALFHLCFYVAHLQGRSETLDDLRAGALLRLLTPITKLMTAKENFAATSELIESFGGAGYIEDTGLPVFLRDAQVLTIWEGTTNVLSLDTLRALFHEKTLNPWFETQDEKVEQLDLKHFAGEKEKLKALMSLLKSELDVYQEKESSFQQAHARELAFTLGHLTSAILLCEHAKWSQEATDFTIARRYLQRSDLYQLKLCTEREKEDRLLLGLT
jgi:putative acyl-CoA dehydrogenase